MSEQLAPRWLEVRGLIETSKPTVVAIADKLLIESGNLRPPVDLYEIGQALHVQLGFSDEQGYDSILDLREWGSRQHDDDWSANTWVGSADTHILDQRVGWAHQIGHLLFHPYPEGLFRTCRWHDQGPEEDAANRFANSLLIPFRMLEREMVYQQDPEVLAKRFLVRPTYMAARIHQFRTLKLN